jgi:hypothetical protein
VLLQAAGEHGERDVDEAEGDDPGDPKSQPASG